MNINVNHYLHFVDDGTRAEILSLLKLLLEKVEKMAHTLDEGLELITDEKTDIASLAAFITSLKQQLADVLAGVSLPPAVQAKVDAIFDAATARKQEIADALAANVP